MTPPTCKAIIEARKVKGNLSELSDSMRRLRLALIQCETCPEQNCPLIMEFSDDITQAISELTLEWGL